ncbi:hypothetical protein M3C36_17175 [Dietzia cinnamea]|uniref:hypothetical protein n=1 Tax=Dietzia cinnamea TaxID=321318 RepID=UPI0021A90A93|nr:hypothetical protein [Dietzia cinnamea]MCT1886878.1 hypothetical protein [Dietzia cinnamea]
MTEPTGMRVKPDHLRGLGSSWLRLADSIDNLDPGGAIAGKADALPGSATAGVLAGAVALSIGPMRSANRFRDMADAARRTADSVQNADHAFADALRRIDGLQ